MTACVVCPHTEREHIMERSGKPWRGDYCTVCRVWCRGEKR